MSVNPSAARASVVFLSMHSRQRAANCGSSNNRAWLSNIKALSALKFFFKKSTQAFSKVGTAYFLAVYRVVITVSGPICTSSVYRKRSNDWKAEYSTSGNSTSSDWAEIPPLNIASKTALLTASTNLWAGIRRLWVPFPTIKCTSLNISLLKRKAIASWTEGFSACQLYGDELISQDIYHTKGSAIWTEENLIEVK